MSSSDLVPRSDKSPSWASAASPAAPPGSELGRSLLGLTAALAEAATLAEVARAIVGQLSRIFAADWAGVWLASAEPGALELLEGDRVAPALRALARDALSPIAEAFRRREPIWMEGRAELERAHPGLVLEPGEDRAVACAPLVSAGRALGCVAFGFDRRRAVEPGELDLLLVLAGHAALALERARLHLALCEANERLATIVGASPLAIALLDLDGTVRLWNPASERMFGWRAEDVIGRFFPAVPDDRRAEYLAYLAEIGAGSVVAGRPFLPADRGEKRLELEQWAARVEDGAGRVQCVSIIADVTARARGQEAQRFLAESSAVLTTSLDYEQSLETLARLVVPRIASSAVVEGPRRDGTFGVIASSHVDPRLEAAVHELRTSFPHGRRRAVSDVLETGEALFVPSLERVVAAVEPPGASVLERLRIRSLMIVPLTARGRSFGTITLVSTLRAFAEEDLALARELAARTALHVDNARLLQEAREAVWLRDDFLGVAGHELKTPITALQLALQSLDRAPPGALAEQPTVVAKRLALCRRQVERLAKLVDELLDVSRITAGRLALELEEIDMVEIAQESIARMTEDFSKAGCEVTCASSGPIVGRWDRLRLDQIVTNLLSNAIKYGKGHPITVELTHSVTNAVITVRDEGIGIAPEDHARIFGRFERAVSQRNYGGLGLGLWIVRQITEALGGTIRVRSAKGTGACFTVELPFAQPDRV